MSDDIRNLVASGKHAISHHPMSLTLSRIYLQIIALNFKLNEAIQQNNAMSAQLGHVRTMYRLGVSILISPWRHHHNVTLFQNLTSCTACFKTFTFPDLLQLTENDALRCELMKQDRMYREREVEFVNIISTAFEAGARACLNSKDDAICVMCFKADVNTFYTCCGKPVCCTCFTQWHTAANMNTAACSACRRTGFVYLHQMPKLGWMANLP